MTPTVGRIVHYTAYGTPGGEFPAGVCRAAVVTEAHSTEPEGSEFVVGLCVLNPTGQYFNRGTKQDKAAQSGPGCEGGTPGTWHWPAIAK